MGDRPVPISLTFHSRDPESPLDGHEKGRRQQQDPCPGESAVMDQLEFIIAGRPLQDDVLGHLFGPISSIQLGQEIPRLKNCTQARVAGDLIEFSRAETIGVVGGCPRKSHAVVGVHEKMNL